MKRQENVRRGQSEERRKTGGVKEVGLEVKGKVRSWMIRSKCVNKERRNREGKHHPKFHRTAEL